MRTYVSELTQQMLQDYRTIPVKLLVGPIMLPPEYTKSGSLAKRQPDPLVPGDTVYARVRDGWVNLYPFDMAGEGYELILGSQGQPQHAVEGVHYEFI